MDRTWGPNGSLGETEETDAAHIWLEFFWNLSCSRQDLETRRGELMFRSWGGEAVVGEAET